jgi:hypothetical protein
MFWKTSCYVYAWWMDSSQATCSHEPSRCERRLDVAEDIELSVNELRKSQP